MKSTQRPRIFGLLAEFDTPQALIAAAEQTHARGYRRIDAYSPFPIEEVADAIGFHFNRLPLIVLIGGIIGGAGGYFMEWYASVVSYPMNIGGRPLNSWPQFIPVTFEMTVLFASLFAVFGMLALNGLPTPYHPVFNVPSFALASKDKFFLLIEARDKQFSETETRAFLESLNPREVTDVAH